MKKLIHDLGNYKLYAELLDCYQPAGHKHLQITSYQTNSKNPEDANILYDVTLDPIAYSQFKELFNN